MFAGNLNTEDFFYQLSLECCLDGKISSEEIKLMQNIARLLGIDTEKANHIANRAIKAYKANKAQDEKTLNADELYQNLLLQLAADGVLDAKEDDVLQDLKRLINADTSKFSATSTQDPEKKVRLKPLECINCKGLIPLDLRQWVKCPFCEADNHIPQSYIDAIVARKAIQRRKSKLVGLEKALGKPPGAFETFLSLWSDYAIFFVFFLFVLLAQYALNIILFSPLIIFYNQILAKNFHDFVSLSTMAVIKTFALYILLAVPMAMAYRAKRKLAALGPLKLALAAGPPKIPGGPETCKNCGSSLVVKADSHVVACNYCETENLVNLPPNWLAKARLQFSDLNLNSEKAFANYKKETGLLWETLATIAAFFFIYAFIMIYIYNCGYYKDDFLPPYSFKQNLRQKIFLNDKRWRTLKTGQWELIELKHGQKSAAHKDIVNLYLAMRAGERITVEWKHEPQHYRKKQQKLHYLEDVIMPDRVKIAWFLTNDARFDGSVKVKRLNDKTLKTRKEITFKSDIAGYHHLMILFPEYQDQFYVKITR